MTGEKLSTRRLLAPTVSLLFILASEAQGAPRYAADVSLLRPVTRAGYAAEPFEAPFVSVFDDGVKRLVFVSGDHGRGASSAVAKTIRKAVAEHRPQAVVVEGLTAGDREAVRRRVREAADHLRYAPGSISENYYAAHAGRRAGAVVLGGEPALSAMRAGLSDEDFLGFLLARTIRPWREGRTLTRAQLLPMAESYLDHERRILGIEKPFRYADFEDWYARKAGLSKPAEELDYNDVGPHEGPDPTFLQRISLAQEKIREPAIVRVIEGALARHDRVLVVYGSGHLVKQRGVWEALLGPSKDAKPF